MDRLGLLVFLSGGMAIPGAFVVLVLIAGYDTIPVILAAAALGLATAIPVCHWVSRKIKKEDPEWDQRRDRSKQVPPSERPAKI